MVTVVERMLTKYGQSCTLVTYIRDNPTDPSKPWRLTSDGVAVPVRGIPLRGNIRVLLGISSAEELILIDGSIVPSLSGTVRLNNQTWKISKFYPITKAEQVLAYVLTVIQ